MMGGGAELEDAEVYFFVSPQGSDEALGTELEPFQTLAKARDAVREINDDMTGDVRVYLRGGDYRMTSAVTFGVEDAASNGHRIYYQAYPGESPTLNGATRVEGWSEHEGGLFRAPLVRSTKLRNLYVNDARAAMASLRTPSCSTA